MLLLTEVLSAVSPLLLSPCSLVSLQVASCVLQCNIYSIFGFFEFMLTESLSPHCLFVLTSIRHASYFSISIQNSTFFFNFKNSRLLVLTCNSFLSVFQLIGRRKVGLKLDFIYSVTRYSVILLQWNLNILLFSVIHD